VFENRVLRKIIGPDRNEVTGEWRKLQNEELHDLYSSPTILWVIKSRGLRWVGHVAQMVEGRGLYRVFVGNLRERDGRIILRWIFRKWDVGVWTGLSWLRLGTGDGQL
jgi:hypothetical protein